jgi:hypothetical protein
MNQYNWLNSKESQTAQVKLDNIEDNDTNHFEATSRLGQIFLAKNLKTNKQTYWGKFSYENLAAQAGRCLKMRKYKMIQNKMEYSWRPLADI